MDAWRWKLWGSVGNAHWSNFCGGFLVRLHVSSSVRKMPLPLQQCSGVVSEFHARGLMWRLQQLWSHGLKVCWLAQILGEGPSATLGGFGGTLDGV